MEAATRTATLREAGAVTLLAIALSWTPLLVLLATTGDPGAGPGSMVLWALGGPVTVLLVPVWLVAAVLVGLLWSVWHLPLFWLTGTTQAATSLVTFTAGAVGLSVVLGWVWNASGGSTLLAVLRHGAVNGWYSTAVQGLAPGSLDAGFGTLTAIAAVLAALVVVAVVGPALASHRAPHDLAPSA